MKSVLRECGSRKEISREMTRIARINASLFFFSALFVAEMRKRKEGRTSETGKL